MPQYGEWFSYGGAARIWLAAGLLAAAGGVACAGTWLPLPVRGARPGRTAVIAAYLAWVAAMAAFVVCFVLYVRQDLHEYHIALRQAQPANPVTSVTILAAVTVFAYILSRGSPGTGTRVASALVGAVAGLAFFEIPYQLIVWVRLYPPIPPDPAFYRALLNVPLLLVDITTLLLLSLSPMVRLTRATFFFLALMLVVFAVWALTGFGYPSAPVPITLNIVSKLLSFAAAITLFLPQRSPRGRTPRLTPDFPLELAGLPGVRRLGRSHRGQ
jgi:hypothetical protein